MFEIKSAKSFIRYFFYNTCCYLSLYWFYLAMNIYLRTVNSFSDFISYNEKISYNSIKCTVRKYGPRPRYKRSSKLAEKRVKRRCISGDLLASPTFEHPVSFTILIFREDHRKLGNFNLYMHANLQRIGLDLDSTSLPRSLRLRTLELFIRFPNAFVSASFTFKREVNV